MNILDIALTTTITFYFAPYRVFRPISNGMYLYLIICLDISCISSSAQAVSRKLDNALDLSSHGQSKEDEEVHEEYWPIDRDIERLRKSAEQCNKCCPC